MIRRFVCLGIGWLIPFVAVIAYYAWIDGLPDLMFLLRYQSYYLRSHDLYVPQILGQAAVVLVSQARFLLLAGWQVISISRRRLPVRAVFLLSFLGFSVRPVFVGCLFFSPRIVPPTP